MAKIKEEILTVKVSTLIRNDAEGSEVLSSAICETLEEVISELVGDSVIVEIIKE